MHEGLSIPSALTGTDLAALDPVAAAAVLTAHSRGSLAERMGILLTWVTATRIEATMPIAGNTQPYGLLHGGASVVLAESIGSLGASLAASQAAGEPRLALGIEINASHHRSVREGHVHAIAVPLQMGRTIGVWSITIRSAPDGEASDARNTSFPTDGPPTDGPPTDGPPTDGPQLICTVRLTCALRTPRPNPA
ncbi:MAG: hotdog fold thioesterase [Actinomycetales bacterium]|nr:hotdog fold thioesterase [Actinomycetales bacterium]